MPLWPRKCILAITAVIDIAVYSSDRPVKARDVAHRCGLAPQYLDALLWALARHGILRSVRGRRGGYQLCRETHRMTAGDIFRAVSLEDKPKRLSKSPFVQQVLTPALALVEGVLSNELRRIKIEDLISAAAKVASKK